MNPEEYKRRCKGILPVQYCPYKKDYSLDVEGLRMDTQFLVDWATKNKADLHIMTNGSTTEFYANSTEEQKMVIKTVVETAAGKVPVVAGVSQAGTNETIKMAKYAKEAGADCAMVVNPYYHCPTDEGLFKHYEAVAKAVPDMAVMVYNNIDVSGLRIDPAMMQRLSRVENIVACKDNSPLVYDFLYKSLLVDPADLVLLHGGPLAYPAAAAYGYKYKGFITVVGLFAPQLVYAIYEAVEKERNFPKATEALTKILPVWNFFGKCMQTRKTSSIIPTAYRANYLYMGVGKACLDLAGLRGGPCRLPMVDITPSEKEELKKILSNMGLLKQ
jgi:4-hydroxy-tetrahydrodipicolinate synthase